MMLRKLLAALVLVAASAAGLYAQTPLQITPITLPGGLALATYDQQLTVSGGTPPYSWSSTTLPTGLFLVPSGATANVKTTAPIPTPLAAGLYNFNVTVTDSASPSNTVTRTYTLAVNLVADITVTPSTLPAGEVGTFYSPITMSAAGGHAPFTWQIVGGALPPGLSMTAGGTISGTPSVAGRYEFTVRASDSDSPSQVGTRTYSLVIRPVVTTTSLTNGAVGVAYSQTLTGSLAAAPVTWAVAGGTNPSTLGLTLASDGTLSGTPTAAGTINFTVTMSDGSTPPVTSTPKALTLVIQPALAISTSTQLPLGVVGSFYTQQLASTGPSPVLWSLFSGSLPPGLSLSSGGTLAGTPSVAQFSTFTVQVTGGTPTQTAQKTFQVTINGQLTVSTLAVSGGTVNAPYTATLSATGGVVPYVWSVGGAPLPPGLNLSPSGVLSGTPSSVGTFTFAVQVSDSFIPTQTATRTLQLVVSNTLTITTSTLPNGAVGTVYSPVTLAASAGNTPYTWTITAGTLPGGIVLSSDGTLSGTPTEAATYNFTVAVADNSTPAQTTSKALTLTTHPALLIRSTSPLPEAVVGVFYSKQLDVSATPNLTWSLTTGNLPPGLGLTTSTGLLVGTPSVAGTYDFTLRATAANPTQTADVSLRLVVNGPLVITTLSTLADASIGTPYTVTLTATGGVLPYRWTSIGTPLPPGLTLAGSAPVGSTPSNTAVISGIPTGLGGYSFTIQVADSFTPSQETSKSFTIAVTNSVTISTDTLPHAIVNLPYSQTLSAVGGTAPLTWVVTNGTLPTGITLTTSGVLQGTPTETGARTVTITVTDGRGKTNSRDFIIAVDPSIPSLVTPGLPLTLTPTQPTSLALSLATPYPSTLTGKLNLVFTSKAEVPSDDPMTQFSNGTRSVAFTIPANSTTAIFPSATSLVTGTVAGTVQLTANFDNGPQNVAVTSVEITAVAPKITNVVAQRTNGGLEVQITGYAPARRVTNVEFTFDYKSGNTTKQTSVTRNVDADFSAWFRNAASTPFGGTFSFVQSFAVQGDATSIQSVTIRLSNAQGGTISSTIPFK